MRKGYITVFFTAVLAICMSLFLVMFTGIRENAIRMKAVAATDTAMTSVFAEYSKELWKQYGLIFVDSSYMTKSYSMKLAEDHLKAVVDKNFDECRLGLLDGKDLLKLKCTEVTADGVILASDNNGKAIKNQAINLMKYYYKIAYLEDVEKWVSEINANNLSSGADYSAAGNASGELISKYKIDYSKWLPSISGGNDISEDTISPVNILNFVSPLETISTKKINLKNYPVKRKMNEGNMDREYEEDITDAFFLREYLLKFCGNYINKKESSLLTYQTEFLCSGKSSDSDNLASVVRRIMVIREAANYHTLSNDGGRMAVIHIVCLGICTLLGYPDACELLEKIVVACWANFESITDVKLLLRGGKVPLIKTPSQWITGINSALYGEEVRIAYSKGLSYEDYLRVFIYFTGEKKVMKRFMSVIEMDMRTTEGNQYFRIDNCFDEWQATLYISSDHGYDFIATRRRRVINKR